MMHCFLCAAKKPPCLFLPCMPWRFPRAFFSSEGSGSGPVLPTRGITSASLLFWFSFRSMTSIFLDGSSAPSSASMPSASASLACDLCPSAAPGSVPAASRTASTPASPAALGSVPVAFPAPAGAPAASGTASVPAASGTASAPFMPGFPASAGPAAV